VPRILKGKGEQLTHDVEPHAENPVLTRYFCPKGDFEFTIH